MLKQPKFRSAKYRRWIASLPCLVCKMTGKTQAAHIRHHNGGGMGMKPGDDNCVPLCVDCHAEQHHHGEVKYWGRNLDKAKQTAQNLFKAWSDDEHERDDVAYRLIARFK